MRYEALCFVALLLRADSPRPVFATYLGGGGNEVVGSVTTDRQGNIYIAGRTDSPDFPLKNAIQPVSLSYSQIFVAKFSPTGDLLYSTYFGGSANDLATGIAADPAGNVYVTGAAPSNDFPVSHAFQVENHGGTDAFVLKIDPSGNVLYATYLGGRFNDHGMAIAADASGNAYVTGRTESPDFPITAGALQPLPAGYTPGYTFISAFVTKLDPSGNLVYSTFLGGGGSNVGWSIAADATGQAHVAGDTSSLDFPIAGNALQSSPGRQIGLGATTSDAFLAKLSADGSSLVYSTVLGGPSQDSARSVTLDSNGNAYITGVTTDGRLPILNGPQQYLGGDVFLVSADGGGTFTARRSGLAAAEVTSLVFDPSGAVEYAGTRQGMFRSTDGGSTWSPAGLDAYWIAHLDVDPSAPGTVYAGTNYGGGIFRTTDRGDTWSSLNTGFPGDSRRAIFSAFAVDPAGSGTVYAFAGFGGIAAGGDQPLFRVTDSGATWTLLGHGLPSSPLSVAVSPDSKLYAGTTGFSFVNQFFGNATRIPGTVYRFDSGAWVSSGLDDDIHALAFQGDTLFAAGRSLYRSTDRGTTWISTPLPDRLTAMRMAVDPRNPSTVYLVAIDSSASRLLRTTDGGLHIDTIGSQPFSAIAVNPADSTLHGGLAVPPDAYVAAFDPTGALIYSTFLGGPSAERGDGIAVDPSGNIYVTGFRSPATSISAGASFVARADGSGYSVDLGGSTATTVLDMPSRGITIAPDGSIVAVMIATQDGLPVQNAVQSNLSGSSDVYLVKWNPQ